MGVNAWYKPLNDIATDAGKIAGAAQKRVVAVDPLRRQTGTARVP